ncbi:PIN domain-containing protein [Neolewinella antarctica]|uniref:Nucleic acid-binding protein n=1 Tax=Neolewinella antarctica TaxID=442734 RepID=A0ABX0XHE2_9BACT|nr:PIN domain-containing protein [Neolewinella antarctica]NJC28172.1 putative nucleic acid-binding protein [Neolewinella antarctica]
MVVYIIDANLVFSAAMKPSSPIGEFIVISSVGLIDFFAPEFLKIEIDRHFDKIVERSKLSAQDVSRQLEIVYKRIKFIPDAQIPLAFWSRAADLVRDIDPDDIIFVALTEYKQELLLTGDMKLYDHLVSKGYQKVINFQQAVALLTSR